MLVIRTKAPKVENILPSLSIIAQRIKEFETRQGSGTESRIDFLGKRTGGGEGRDVC